MNWSAPEKRGQDFTRIAGSQTGVKTVGHANAPGFGNTAVVAPPASAPAA